MVILYTSYGVNGKSWALLRWTIPPGGGMQYIAIFGKGKYVIFGKKLYIFVCPPLIYGYFFCKKSYISFMPLRKNFQ